MNGGGEEGVKRNRFCRLDHKLERRGRYVLSPPQVMINPKINCGGKNWLRRHSKYRSFLGVFASEYSSECNRGDPGH